MNCTQDVGPARLACMKALPAKTLQEFLNGPETPFFSQTVDKWLFASCGFAVELLILWHFSITVFTSPIDRISSHQTARVPILLGENKDDGSLFLAGNTNPSLESFLQSRGNPVSADEVRVVYPNFLGNIELVETVIRDIEFTWYIYTFLRCLFQKQLSTFSPIELTAKATIRSGVPNVFRYVYGELTLILRKPYRTPFNFLQRPRISRSSGVCKRRCIPRQRAYASFQRFINRVDCSHPCM